MQTPFSVALAAVALAAVLAAAAAPCLAQDQPLQRPALQSPALNRVEDVPARLRALAAAHPDRARLEQVGLSLAGREILALRVGPPEGDPPGLLIVAGLDGRRVSDVDAALLVAESLLEGDAAPPALATACITIVPLANPDGAAALLGQDGPPRERAGNGRPDDADRDGRTDEDGPDDLDGDGALRWMRVPDAQGEWVADAHDPRALRVARRGRGERGAFRLIPEGRDDDADGADSEDGTDGVQPDRNFMHGWKEHDPASGIVPLSEPEARALCAFVLARPRLFAVLVLGGQDTLVDLPKGDAKVPDDWSGPLPSLLEDDRALLDELQRRFRALPGGKDHKVKGEGLTAGSFLAWSYHQAGRLPLALRLWEPPKELPKAEEKKADGEAKPEGPAKPEGDAKPDAEAQPDGEPKAEAAAEKPADDPKTEPAEAPPAEKPKDEPADVGPRGRGRGGEKSDDDEPDDDKPGSDPTSPVPAAVLAWLDKERAGAGFAPWTAFDHPQLGAVEIGGLLPGTLFVAPPAVVAEKAPLVSAFALSVLEARPQLAFEKLRAERGADGVYVLHATLANTGALPAMTALARSARALRPVSVRLQLPDGAARLAGPVAARAGRLDGGGGHEEFRWVLSASAGQIVRLSTDSDALLPAVAELELP